MEGRVLCLCLLFLFRACSGRTQLVGQLLPGFQTTQMEWAEKDGLFLLSNKSTFGFGFYTSLDVQLFVLVVLHLKSEKVVWTANRGLLVRNSDKFVFENDGNVYLQRGNGLGWSSDTGGKGIASMELMDSGNLVLLGGEGNVVWQSFDHPTDTLLPGQVFVEGMKLKSFHNKNNLSNYLEFQSGDLVLYAGFDRPQTYWSLSNDSRKTNSSVRGRVHSASLASNSWNFYNQDKVLLWQFVFFDRSDLNATWAIKLGSDGEILFYNLQNGRSVSPEAFKIPQNPCGVPEPCDLYYVCYFDNWCQCPSQLNSQFGCKPDVVSTCNGTGKQVDLFRAGERLHYFALGFVVPSLKSNLNACKEACLKNCSCTVLFFEESSGNCFLFDQMGSFTRAPVGSAGYISYLKVSKGELSSAKSTHRTNEGVMVAVIIIATLVVIAGLMYLGLWCNRKTAASKLLQEQSDDDFDSFTGMPVRYTYNDLCTATKDFTMKIGQGGFGSVYTGILPDGSRLAVKKLEGIGQGKKEFRAEVNIIGSIHHVHLVKLKGFCAEGTHRLLVYEYMGNGSLDKWIFKNSEGSFMLDWSTRFNIALGTAKGLAYLHEECEVKIVHCDIKPENVLLDDNFTARVSDFGLAKLMNRDDSHVYTTVRGTRGYLAPEWITNNPISEKSDVYSYGIVLLEIIRGRRNFNSTETSAQSSLPLLSFKMLEEGKLKQIIDPKLIIEEHDETIENVIKVALWCIQDEMQLRPPMTKVVQMLQGLCPVPDPPISLPGTRSNVSFMNWNSQESSSGGLVGFDSEAFQSDIRLSGPR